VPGGAVVVTHGTWAIPRHIPDVWGPEVRARMAGALLLRHVAPPRSGPVLVAEGPSGATPVPMQVERGACYVAVASITHGHARGIELRAKVGAREALDERPANEPGGAVAFCAGDRDRALLHVEARGSPLGWGMLVFRVESGVWQVER
jgi:hypothetical protein